MADLTYSSKATERKSSPGVIFGKGDSGNVKALISTVEVAPSASGTTLKFGTIPSNARISAASMVYWDDLSTTGSPTLDLGLGSVDSNVTSDPDALSNGHAVSSAGSASALTDIANAGLPAWDLVASVTSDPGGALDVYGSIKDAATAGLTGTVTVEVYYTVD